MKIALLEPIGVDSTLVDELAATAVAKGHEFVRYGTRTSDPDELIVRSEGCEVVMIANNPYPDEVIRASKALRYLNVAFTGIDHVGLAACRERGILVSNAANYSNETVAELVIGMAISLLRRIPQGDAVVRSRGTSAGLCGREICGRTVGVVGTGRIGMMVVRLFRAMGAYVVACDVQHNDEALAMGVSYLPLDELMRCSDIVTIHTPNIPSTRCLISRDMIGLMKRSAMLINCARGPIVDNEALADALNSGAIAGAGIDVFDMEPPLPDDYPLLRAKNALLTPHVAFLSEESMIRRARILFDNLYAYLDGKPKNLCNF